MNIHHITETNDASALRNSPLNSWYIAGFECTTHRNSHGKRLDLIAATKHDRFAAEDYERIAHAGILAAREGVRWDHCEKSPGQYDFSSLIPIIDAARSAGCRIMWDLCHFGWPDHIDIVSPDFPAQFARYGHAFAEFISEQGLYPIFIPINEISFIAYAGGEEGGMLDPHLVNQGNQVKTQLICATIACIDAIREVEPNALFSTAEPVIHVTNHPDRPEDAVVAQRKRLSVYQTWDILAGKFCPEFGGGDRYLGDIIGVNFYYHNQWYHDDDEAGKRTHKYGYLKPTDSGYKPFRSILLEVYVRYGRPILVTETGAEYDNRGPWLRMINEECEAAMKLGVPLLGVCWYPILEYPDWDSEIWKPAGIWSRADADGRREPCEPVLAEIASWHERETASLRPR